MCTSKINRHEYLLFQNVIFLSLTYYTTTCPSKIKLTQYYKISVPNQYIRFKMELNRFECEPRKEITMETSLNKIIWGRL